MKEEKSHQQVPGHVTQSGAETGSCSALTLLHHLVAEQVPNVTPV